MDDYLRASRNIGTRGLRASELKVCQSTSIFDKILKSFAGANSENKLGKGEAIGSQ